MSDEPTRETQLENILTGLFAFLDTNATAIHLASPSEYDEMLKPWKERFHKLTPLPEFPKRESANDLRESYLKLYRATFEPLLPKDYDFIGYGPLTIPETGIEHGDLLHIWHSKNKWVESSKGLDPNSIYAVRMDTKIAKLNGH